MTKCLEAWSRHRRPVWTFCGREVVVLPPLTDEEWREMWPSDAPFWGAFWVQEMARQFVRAMSEDTRREAVQYRTKPSKYISRHDDATCVVCMVNLDKALELGHVKTKTWPDGVTVSHAFGRHKPDRSWWQGGVWVGPASQPKPG